MRRTGLLRCTVELKNGPTDELGNRSAVITKKHNSQCFNYQTTTKLTYPTNKKGPIYSVFWRIITNSCNPILNLTDHLAVHQNNLLVPPVIDIAMLMH